MEIENKRELLDFWMTAMNYKQILQEKGAMADQEDAQTDALIIYDKLVFNHKYIHFIFKTS